MPGDVFHHGRVSGEDGFGVDDSVLTRLRVDVPQADGVIVRGGEEVTVQVRVPWEAVTGQQGNRILVNSTVDSTMPRQSNTFKNGRFFSPNLFLNPITTRSNQHQFSWENLSRDVQIWSSPFLLMSSQSQVRITLAARFRFRWMLGVVENEHIRRRGLGGDHARVLGHVAGSIHFAFVVDFWSQSRSCRTRSRNHRILDRGTRKN